MADFFARLEEACRTKNSLLCIGLDPRLSSSPNSVRHSTTRSGDSASIEKAIVSSNRRLIDQTLPYAAAYKPNMAFYEAWGSCGLSALEETIRLIPNDVPIILDAKRSDIGSTARAYAQSAFEHFDVDAVTLSPYMGKDAVDPFLDYQDRGIFVLCRTSNPAASKLQDLTERESGEMFYLRVAQEIVSWSSRLGLVVAGNDLKALRLVRQAHPSTWFLAPGIGVQGGSAADAVLAGRRQDGFGVLAVVVRSIAEADNPAETAKAFRDQLNEGRSGVTVPGFEPRRTGVSNNNIHGHSSRHQAETAGDGALTETTLNASEEKQHTASQSGDDTAEYRKRMVLHGLVRTGCFRVGDFTLKSGIRSPFYIDLRRTISDPVFLKLVAQAYVEMSRNLDFSRIAAIPTAGLPLATATSLETGVPMIYPRLSVKDHGTGNRIEGEFRPGERILLLDDLITTGLSKVEAAEVLRAEGLEVVDLVVLLERARGGRADLSKAGISLHAYAQVTELFSTCRQMGVIDEVQEQQMTQFVENGN